MEIIIVDHNKREICSFEAWDIKGFKNCDVSHFEVDDEGNLVLILMADF
tara:strand:+ start:445 stop:591 length:147 start_codon:yes stop_codon:yes gene_type:complete